MDRHGCSHLSPEHASEARNCVIGANSVCRGEEYPSHSVIGPESAKILYRRIEDNE